jgi:hypothetical protein
MQGSKGVDQISRRGTRLIALRVFDAETENQLTISILVWRHMAWSDGADSQ